MTRSCTSSTLSTVAVFACVTLASCGSHEAVGARDGAAERLPATRGPNDAPATDERGPSKKPGSAPRLIVQLDPAYRGCKVDADCQITIDCACTQCIPTKQMHVDPCPETCTTSPCAGHAPRCTAGLCVAAGVESDAPSAEVMEATRAAGQLVLDDPRFTTYLHADVHPDRLPVVVAWEPLLPRPAWKIGGKDARFTDGIPPAPQLVPRSVVADVDQATFVLDYVPEGAIVNARVERRHGTWTVAEMSVAER